MGTKRRFWAVVKTKQASSRDAIQNATRQGFEVLHVMYRDRPERGVRRVRPLFPHYLLVRIGRHLDWRVLNSTRGISHLFMSGDEPSRVPDYHVEHFRSLEDELGYFAHPDTMAPRFNHGEGVTPTTGLYAGCDGIYQGLAGNVADRVRVLFSFLGKPLEVEMRAYDLARVA